MSEEQGTLRAIAHHLTLALEPLDRAFRDEDRFRILMYRLGWEVQGLPPAYVTVADRALAAVQALRALADTPTLQELLSLIDKVGAVYQAIQSLGAAPPGTNAGEFLPEIARRLFEYLLVDYLARRTPGFHSTLQALGIIVMEDNPPAGGRPGYVRMRMDWERIPEAMADPISIPTQVYGWGTADFDFPRVMELLGELFDGLGLHSSLDFVASDTSLAFQSQASDTPVRSISDQISVSFIDVPVGGEVAGVGFKILELPAEGSAFEGILIQPDVPQGIAQQIPLGGSWTFNLRAGTDLAEQFGVYIRPGEIGLRYPFAPGHGLPSAGFGMAFGYAGATPLRLFGSPDGVRLELASATLSQDLDLKNGDLEYKIAATVEGTALILTAKDFDGFIGSALGAGALRIEFPLGLSWSNRTGLDFIAGAGFELSIYPHLDLGVLRFDRIDLAFRFIAGAGTPPMMDLRVATALSGELGPLAYTVDRLGIQLPVVFESGNAGPFDIDFGVLWPNALGLVIDAGTITGGGYVRLDPDRGRYEGILELKMFEIGVTAIAILDTKDDAGRDLPSPGFSFFMSIAVELPPIQLGYGFTLNGVGGLAGINRRMDTEAILSGVREGALDSIMFPDDPVRNATAIISNLSAIFPPRMDRYVFGPMAIIGWGTPTLIRVELGIVLEVPAPIVLALLGQASVAIPEEDVAIVSLNLDVVGILDFGRERFAVDASLRDSYVATFSIYGDMAMRLSWSRSPNFALSVGGLNPHFDPPVAFPVLRRVTVALGLGDNPRISLEGYFAVTSNSLQFGAKAELYAAAAGFNVRGWLAFDALLIFQPFSFRFDFSVGMTLNKGSSRVAGITVRGTLTGPSPFHAWGKGCISVLFFDVCVPFDATFGDRREVDLPDKDPWPLLQSAIKTLENWSAELSGDVAAVVSLRPPEADPAMLLLHPMGTSTLRQKVLPFNRTLERFGEFDIIGPDRFDIAGISIGDRSASNWRIVKEHFPPGDFERLSETEKLSRDSFEEMDAGISVGGDIVDAPLASMKVAKVEYETRIIDSPWDARTLPLFVLSRVIQLATGLRGAKAFSAIRHSGRAKFARDISRETGMALDAEVYSTATTDDLSIRPDIAVSTTRGAAHMAIKTKIGRGRAANTVQVVPSHELEEAA